MKPIEFLAHLEETKEQLLDAMTTEGYKDQFNVTITCNGKSIELELHADLWSNLVRIMEEE